jgi:hypothetical protein
MKGIINRALQAIAPRARIARALAAVALAGLFTAACGDSTGPKITATVTISPTSATIAAGGTQQFTAVVKNSKGNVLAVTPIWAVTSGGGTITATGLFTAPQQPGTSTVSVSCSGITATATVTVTPGPLATITVTPNPATLAPGALQTFTAVGRDALNNVVAITPVWTVVNGGGSINASSGVFTAGPTQGTYTNTVVATSGALSGSATVIVTPTGLATITVTPNPATVQVGTNQQFTAVGRDASGNIIAITPVWSATNPPGTINAATGLFTAALTTGTFPNSVTATSGSISGSATVIVTSTPPPAPIINLGSASGFGILAGQSVTCVTGGFVGGDIGISPGSTLTGFGPCTLSGVKHLGDPTAATAQGDLTVAYNQAAGLACPPANNVGTTNLGGTTKPAGVYCSASSIGVTGDLTLDGGGDPNATFVFQAGSTLTTAGNIILIGGAQAKNVYWQVGSSATIGVSSKWQGNILALTSITLVDNATLLGRALARNGSVTLGTNNVITLP